MPKTNLSLKNLRRAITGRTSGPYRLGKEGRGSAAPTSFLDFAIDIVGSIDGDDVLFVEEEGEYELNFTSIGSLFISKLAGRTVNGQWTTSDEEVLSVFAQGGYQAIFTGAGEGSAEAECTWADYFNIDATGYNTLKSFEVSVISEG